MESLTVFHGRTIEMKKNIPEFETIEEMEEFYNLCNDYGENEEEINLNLLEDF